MRRRLLLLPVLTAAVALRALWFEPRRTVVHREDLRLEHWPATLDGLRLALVADLHTGAGHVGLDRVREVVELIQREEPDLVLLAGDLLDDRSHGAERVHPEAVAIALGALRAPLGVRAVLGNHDRDTRAGAGQLADALRRHGVDVLQDDARRLEHRGAPFWVAGAGGTYAEARDARPALARVPEDEPVLLLVHEPDILPSVPPRVALTLAGHTHGGQLAVPGLRALWTPSRRGARYARRHVHEAGRRLVVTSGVGTSTWPVRLGAPPEVLVLTLLLGSSTAATPE